MRCRALVPASLAIAGALTGAASAHEVRPAYLELRQTGPETYDVLWKVPRRGDLRLGLEAQLPAECEVTSPVIRQESNGACVDRWGIRCAGGLAGRTLRIEGLSATLTDVLLRLEHADGTAQVVQLRPSSPSVVVSAVPDGPAVVGTYLRLGMEHIAFGIDHLLFVLALLLLVEDTRRLIITVTAFTVAHSITLAAATLGFVHVAQPPVEAIIALSILFVAGELVHERRGRAGLTRRRPWLIAFVFGLLHGLGFAGALAEVGLPEKSIPLALLFFNVGVEVGQILFIGLALAVRVAFRRVIGALPWQPAQLAAYVIGSIAAYWAVERVAGFWT